MRHLPLNDKGYPVPWFVEWVDDRPDFRIMDHEKWARAIRHKVCWLCGDVLGSYKTFVAGPMCGVNRTSAEPPSHFECATYAAKACPFLTLPKAMRRDAGLPEHLRMKASTVEEHIIGGVGITRNPGVAMLWTCRDYKLVRTPNGYIIRMGEPNHVEWYAEGRPATRAEVEESVRTGLPFLQKMADDEGNGAPAELSTLIERFQVHLPRDAA
jgi:hypothetical protein